MSTAVLQVCEPVGVQVIKLVINAGKAKPGPPVGAALGQAGLKIMDFVKDFNAATAGLKASAVQRSYADCAWCKATTVVKCESASCNPVFLDTHMQTGSVSMCSGHCFGLI